MAIDCTILGYSLHSRDGARELTRADHRARAVARLDAHVRHLLASDQLIIGFETLREALGGGPTPPRRAILLSFDAPADWVLSVAAPVLRRHGLEGVAYVPGPDDGASDAPRTLQGWQALRACGLRIGHWLGNSIPGHGIGDLARLSRAREQFGERLARDVRDCAFPVGRVDQTRRRVLEAAGYCSAAATGELDSRQIDPLALRRVHADLDDDAARLSWRLWRARGRGPANPAQFAHRVSDAIAPAPNRLTPASLLV